VLVANPLGLARRVQRIAAAGTPSATATLAMRPPNDLPPTQTGSSVPALATHLSNDARTVATATGGRSGERFPASM
jgi:hypothetical protein